MRAGAIPFLMMIAPNKEGIYREYMPDAYKRVWDGNRPGQLEDYIREHSDVTVLDPREYFNTNRIMCGIIRRILTGTAQEDTRQADAH